MMTYIRPRFRVPVIVAAAGTVLAIAFAVRGGPTWWLSIFIEVGVLGRVLLLFLLGGDDSDEGALAGSRTDERQRLVASQASAVSGRAVMVAAVLGLSASIAAHAPAAWAYAFAIMLFVACLSFLLGLSHYGPGDAGQ
jgi:hypothetical protein